MSLLSCALPVKVKSFRVRVLLTMACIEAPMMIRCSIGPVPVMNRGIVAIDVADKTTPPQGGGKQYPAAVEAAP